MLEKAVLKHMESVNCQENQQRLWMQRLRAAALSMARVSLVLVVMLLVVGFSLAFVDQGNIAHAAHVDGQPYASEAAETADSSMPAVGFDTGASHELATPCLCMQLPLSTDGIGGGTTVIFKHITINVETKELEVEFEFN